MRLSARLPDQQRNGLGSIADQMVRDHDAVHLVIGYVSCAGLHINHATGTREPVAGIVHVEVVRPADRGAAVAMVEAAYAERTTLHRAAHGETPLPLEDTQ